MQNSITTAVTVQLSNQQASLFEEEKVDLAAVVVPKGEVTGYHPFTRDMSELNLQPSERDIVIQSLETNEQETLAAQSEILAQKPEDYIVHTLID